MTHSAEEDDLIARLIQHILADRAHMHCPLRGEIEERFGVLPPGGQHG